MTRRVGPRDKAGAQMWTTVVLFALMTLGALAVLGAAGHAFADMMGSFELPSGGNR